MTHPHPKGNFVPKAVLMKSGIKTLNTVGQNFLKVAVSVNTARPINTAYPRQSVNSARIALNVFNRAHSHVRRPFNNSTTNKNINLKEKVNIVKGNVTTDGPKAVVSDNKGNEANAVKASACWVWRPKQKILDHGNPQLELHEKGVIDSGCSRHMTGNKSYLSDYEENDGGFVAFKGSMDVLDDQLWHNLEEIVYSDDDEDVGVEADMTNLDTHIPVSPIPTTRIHKDHPGYTQEEGTYYDEVFAPVARLSNRSTKKELCTEFDKSMHKKFQMSSMGELTSLRITASTPMETSKPLMKDENAEDVDVHLYRLMMSLMYLTSLRPDIMFAVKTINGEVQIQALVDKKKVIITETSIRRDLQLADENGYGSVGRTARIESSEDEGLGDQEDASKQGRKIADIDADKEVTLIDET
ncbi:hypothetical protein Tco_0500212 [Tanacetum coccineum]